MMVTQNIVRMKVGPVKLKKKNADKRDSKSC